MTIEKAIAEAKATCNWSVVDHEPTSVNVGFLIWQIIGKTKRSLIPGETIQKKNWKTSGTIYARNSIQAEPMCFTLRHLDTFKIKERRRKTWQITEQH